MTQLLHFVKGKRVISLVWWPCWNLTSDKPILELNPDTGFVWFCLVLYVNNYGHVGMVSSPNHTFFLGKLVYAVNQYFVHILSLVTDNNLEPVIKGMYK